MNNNLEDGLKDYNKHDYTRFENLVHRQCKNNKRRIFEGYDYPSYDWQEYVVYASFLGSGMMALLILTNKKLLKVYPMAYMALIELTQAAFFSQQAFKFDICDFQMD